MLMICYKCADLIKCCLQICVWCVLQVWKPIIMYFFIVRCHGSYVISNFLFLFFGNFIHVFLHCEVAWQLCNKHFFFFFGVCPNTLDIFFSSRYDFFGHNKGKMALWEVVRRAVFWCIWLESVGIAGFMCSHWIWKKEGSVKFKKGERERKKVEFGWIRGSGTEKRSRWFGTCGSHAAAGVVRGFTCRWQEGVWTAVAKGSGRFLAAGLESGLNFSKRCVLDGIFVGLRWCSVSGKKLGIKCFGYCIGWFLEQKGPVVLREKEECQNDCWQKFKEVQNGCRNHAQPEAETEALRRGLWYQLKQRELCRKRL